MDTRPLGKAYDAIRSRTDRLPKEPALTGARRTASRLVPTRGKLGFPFSLAAIPLEEREPVFMSHNTWAFFDGKRTLLDCIRMSDAETGRPSTTSSIARTIAELRRIEKYGYVSLKSTGV